MSFCTFSQDTTLNKDLQLIEDSRFPCIVKSNNDDLVLCETSNMTISHNKCETFIVKEQVEKKKQAVW